MKGKILGPETCYLLAFTAVLPNLIRSSPVIIDSQEWRREYRHD